ncbi:40S ribosomal protein [Pelomyxa schiedti]|nr:40S ribosomal protein [Pelomyxa schiedti]
MASDGDVETSEVPTEEVTETTAPEGEEAPAEGEGADILNVLKEVLKISLIHNGLVRGLRECAKMLDKGKAQLCVLASNCEEPAYIRLVEALCTTRKVSLIKVPDSMKLGEWVGLCKIDKDGVPRKVVGCSCCVIYDFGEKTAKWDELSEYLKKHGLAGGETSSS